MAKKFSRPTTALKHKIVIDKISENPGKPIGKILRESGYSESTAKTPSGVLGTKTFAEVLESVGLTDEAIAKTHKDLMTATHLDHMIFPPYNPVTEELDEDAEDQPEEELEPQPRGGALKRRHKPKDRGEQLTDKDIREMLASVNCTVRKIVNGEQARHVYFWSADNRARKDAVDMAYKITNRYKETMEVNVNQYKKLTDSELAARIAASKKFFKKK